jgi:hypothetical protein
MLRVRAAACLAAIKALDKLISTCLAVLSHAVQLTVQEHKPNLSAAGTQLQRPCKQCSHSSPSAAA